MSAAIHATREAWLHAAIDKLSRTEFEAARRRAGAPQEDRTTERTLVTYLPPASIRASVGFPYGVRGSKTGKGAIGQYWPGALIADAVPHVYISPVLGDPLRVLDVLVHELVHAARPKAGHGTAFKQLALAVGLTGKMTCTVASPELKARLQTLAESLGEYPHGAAIPNARPGKKQTTRMIKLECPDCGMIARTTRQWLRDSGAPLCGCRPKMPRRFIFDPEMGEGDDE